MAVATPTTQLAMTNEQRRSFDEQGFILIENFFSQAELDRLLSAIDEVAERVRAEKGLGENDPFALRNALTHHEAFLDLIDNPRILPLVVDAIGWNIQIRTTHLDYRPPYPEGLEAGELGTGEGADHAATTHGAYGAAVPGACRAHELLERRFHPHHGGASPSLLGGDLAADGSERRHLSRQVFGLVLGP